MKVRRLPVILVVVVMLSVALHWCLKGNAPYSVEVRRMGPDGVAVYERKTPEGGWPFSANIAAIRRHSLARIDQAVYFNGAVFNFSQSGVVYATRPGEMGAPFEFLRGWNWSGDPHQFPCYDYADSLSKNG